MFYNNNKHICDEFDNSLCIFVRHELFPFYTIVFCSYIMCCVYSFMYYSFLYVLYFILNLNEIESEMVLRNENMTHITVLIQHTKHELQ